MSELKLFPTIKPHSNKLDEAYEVAKDFCVMYQDFEIWVPRFFQYDGASIPAVAYHIVGTPFNPRYMTAAVVHDWIYHTHQIQRDQADKLFHKMLLEAKVGKIKAFLMREAVENFGGLYWENDSDDKKYKKHLIKLITNSGGNPDKYGL